MRVFDLGLILDEKSPKDTFLLQPFSALQYEPQLMLLAET